MKNNEPEYTPEELHDLFGRLYRIAHYSHWSFRSPHTTEIIEDILKTNDYCEIIKLFKERMETARKNGEATMHVVLEDFLKIFCGVPLNEVPLYINISDVNYGVETLKISNVMVSEIAKWRLEIAK